MIRTPKAPKGAKLLGELIIGPDGTIKLYDEATGSEVFVMPDGSIEGLDGLSQEDMERIRLIFQDASEYASNISRKSYN